MNTHLLNRGTIRIDNLFFGAVLAVAFLCGFAPQKAEAQAEVSFEYFQDSLQPYGNWVDVEEYGPCWVPSTNYSDWRPYSDGSWAYTECGWTWVSDEPWGWATYHYGRWVYLDGPGWAWVPGYEWAPAWVAWRSSDDYIGWAPLPPEAVWVPNRGFSVNVNFNFGPTYYNFCEVRNFGSRRLRDVICRRDQNVTIIRNTVNVTRIVNNNTTIINQGPDIEAVNRRSERRIERLRLERRQDANGVQRAERQGDRLEVFAPKVRAPEASRRAERTDRPQRTERRINQVQADQNQVVADTKPRRSAQRSDAVESNNSKELNAAPPERQNNRRQSGARSQPERRQSRVVEPAVQAPVSDRIVEQKPVAPIQDRAPQVREQKREPRVRSEVPRNQEARQPRTFQQAPQAERQREPRVRSEAPRVQEQRQERAVQRAPEPERQRERPAQQVRENKREAPPAAQQEAPTLEQLTEKKRHGH